MAQDKHHSSLNNINMKTTIKLIIVIFSLLNINIACSQVNPLTQVKASQLSIVNDNGNEFPFFGTLDQLISSFGQPLLKSKVLNADMLDSSDIEDYIYNGVKLRFENRSSEMICISFKINSENYAIKYGDKTIRINDSIDDLKDIFIESFNFMNLEDENILRIEFNELNDIVTPYFSPLIIKFDRNTRKINSIRVYIMS